MHIVQHGHSRTPVFFEDSDYTAYLAWLKEGAERYGCDIHAYVLMTNHVHILATPSEKNSVTRMMQYVGRRYVPYINHSYGTSGSLWEGRYKASLVQEDGYFLCCALHRVEPG
jgi:putative transposase